MSHPILYCGDNACTWAIDLPTSVAWAQGSCSQLRSPVARSHPFESTEPRGARRDRILATVPRPELEYDRSIQAGASEALERIGRHFGDSKWCMPRCGLVRDVDWIDDGHTTATTETMPAGFRPSPPLVLSFGSNSFDDLQQLQNGVVHNPSKNTASIVVPTVGTFWIPARSTFINSTVEHALSAFEAATRISSLSNRHPTGRVIEFDLILLDPPWANRSVRRSQTYASTEDQRSDPFVQIQPTLIRHLAHAGFIAIWITNKARVRHQVTNAFALSHLVLLEEWIWLKTTDRGQPILPIDGLWRKPYEILLIFSRSPSSLNVSRRFIIAVPDVHSRKPNLKCVFERVLALPHEYNALEVFARSLTSGWWSWGDEVLKFQNGSQWVDKPSLDSDPAVNAAVSDDHDTT